MFAFDETVKTMAKLKVIGVGGAGGNAINRMVDSGLKGVEFIAVNTDAMALEHNKADVKIHIGQKLTQGLGAGANPQVGMMAAEEDRERVRAQLDGADMVFIAAGMGGGTGTGAGPVVCEIAREMNILTVAVVTRPFQWEGPVREKNAGGGLDALRKCADTVIVVPNQKLLSVVNKNTTLREAFRMADDVLCSATRGISDIILKHGDIQVDFADVRAIMAQGGDALMGTGVASGENRATIAADRAIHSPLLENLSIAGATGVLVNITGGDDLGIMEINDAMNFIYEAVGSDTHTNIIFGTVINPEMKDEIAITVIATGFGTGAFVPKPIQHARSAPPAPAPARRAPLGSVYIEERSISSSVHGAPATPGIAPSHQATPHAAPQNIETPKETLKPQNFERPFRVVEEHLNSGKVPFSSQSTPPSQSSSSHSGQAPTQPPSGRMPFLRNPLAAQNLNRDDERQAQPQTDASKTSSLFGSSQKGRYRDTEGDVDYETPAFLRNQAD
jgi:cell division protein FtsZ